MDLDNPTPNTPPPELEKHTVPRTRYCFPVVLFDTVVPKRRAEGVVLLFPLSI